MLAKRTSDLQHITQVGATILVRWRTHGAKNDIHVIQTRGQSRRKMQPAFLGITQYHLFQPRLINRDIPLQQAIYFLPVDIHASDINPHLGKTSPGHQAYVAGADNCDIHKL